MTRHDKTITITMRVTGSDSTDEHDLVSQALAFVSLKHKSERPLLNLAKAGNFAMKGRGNANVIGTIETKESTQ